MDTLTPKRFDFTLWLLFCTALMVTFVLYRIAELRLGVKEARWSKSHDAQGPIDKKLIFGASMFGIGWGMRGGRCTRGSWIL